MEKDKDKKNLEKDDIEYIYRPWITKNGQRIYAKTYGLRAFKIPVNN